MWSFATNDVPVIVKSYFASYIKLFRRLWFTLIAKYNTIYN